jgi:hypothetical protein
VNVVQLHKILNEAWYEMDGLGLNMGEIVDSGLVLACLTPPSAATLHLHSFTFRLLADESFCIMHRRLDRCFTT